MIVPSQVPLVTDPTQPATLLYRPSRGRNLSRRSREHARIRSSETVSPMRIAYLASGAGGMYCGSCMRDNRIAATLIAQGRDVVLIPLYTPLRTDETDVSR